MRISDLDESDRLDEQGQPQGPPYDVFLSYNADDGHVVRNVARRLCEAGVRVWYDKESLPLGASWQPELEARLLDSRACAVCYGPQDIIGWERLEMEVALDRATRDHGFRVFAVLLPGIGYFDASMLPPLLATKQWVDLRDGPESAAAIQDLVNAIHGVARPVEVLSDDGSESPYRGLEMFEEEHAPYFFGRRAQVQRLLEALRRDRFLALVGQSGVGKSSLLRAGLLPRLKAGAVAGSELWRVLVLRPGAHPATTLAAKIVGLRPEGGMQGTVDRLTSDDRTLYMAATLAVADEPAGSKLLLLVDQFEEIFTLCLDRTERSAFLSNLLYAAAVPHGHAVVVVAMRADFYPHLAEFPEFAQLAQSHHVLVGRMADTELREVILEPAYKAGLSVEQGLADTILDDVEREPGNLPLLEHALLETWRNRRGRELTLEGYRATGGVQHGLGERAEAVYESLSDEGRVQARNLFLRLIQPGEGTEDTRRRIAMSEVTTSDGDAVTEAVRGFVGARLLTTSVDDATNEPRIEISHEAVITGWERCRRWVDEDRAGLLVHRRLTVAAQEWKRHGRNKDALYRGVPLGEAMAWRARAPGRLNWLEQDFLDAGRAAEHAVEASRRRRVRITFAALLAVIVVIIAVAVVAVRQRDVAMSRQFAADASTALDVDPALSLTLALRANDVASTTQAEEVLRQSTAQSKGRSVLNGEGGPVYAVRFMPDGRHVVSGSADGILRLWDVTDGKLQRSYPVHHEPVFAIRASVDGRSVVSGSRDGVVALTTLADGQSRVVMAAAAGVSAVELSPSGALLAVALRDGTTRVLDFPSGRERAVLPGDEVIDNVAFSPDGALLATAGSGGRCGSGT